MPYIPTPHLSRQPPGPRWRDGRNSVSYCSQRLEQSSLLQLLLLKRTIILAAFVGCLAAIAQTPGRKVVNNNIIISDHDPKVRIELPKSVWYVGVDRFVLLDIADCELYAFVEVDDQKNVQRLYWIQFEDYLPSKPELQHHYESPRHMTIGGFRFYVDTWVKRTNENITAGSDEDHIVALILSRGYNMPAGMMSVRLVHLLDEQKRKELMIIYSENLTGFAAADLKKGGKAENLWPSLEDDLLVRARQEIKIEVP